MNTPSRSNRSLKDIIIEIDGRPQEKGSPCTIFRVPLNLGKEDKDAYEPKLVSLGPYHRTNSSLREMEETKSRCVHGFLKRIAIPSESSDLGRNLDRCKDSLSSLEFHLRSCYSENIHMNSDEFTEMMLLDGCFILEVMNFPAVIDSPWKFQLVALDMLMLENQIPFEVLHKLHELGFNKTESLRELMINFAKIFLPEDFEPPQSGSFKPFHLLHQIHFWMIQSQNVGYQQDLRPRYRPLGRREKEETEMETIPRAVELQEVGIKFRPKKEKGAAPMAVSFKKGVLEMSLLRIYKHVEVLFGNLIAFEHCHVKSGSYVTDYVFFLNRLMNTSKDVSLLHDKGVMLNGLGAEVEVAELFNKLSKNVIWDSTRNELRDVFLGINEHCRFKLWKWRATLTRDYFGSPWLMISVLAASAILLFTLTQTIFAILSYVRHQE